LWALCFATEVTIWLPWVALLPLLELSRHRRPFLHGLLHGIVFWLVSISWIVGTLESYGGLSKPVAFASLALLSVYLGLYHAVFAGVGGRIWKRGGSTAVWALPALWVVLEVAREYLLSGFPWNLAAYSVIEVPGTLDLASWVGAYGVSFLVVAGNVAVLLLLGRRFRRRAVVALALSVVILALAGVTAPSKSEPPVMREVRVVQPNTPILASWDRKAIITGYQELLRLAEAACEPGALVIWPESAAWPFELGRDPQLGRDLSRLAARGCSIILNSVSRDGERHFNSAYLVEPDGTTDRYDKRHLVPFGEYVPLRTVFPFLRRLARAAGDFSAGRGEGALSWMNERLGMAICFEIVFPGEVAARVRDGASVLVTITNDGWYGDTAAPRQHFRAARFRAAENRRPLVRAALTGISAFVSPRGRVERRLAVGETGVLTGEVAPGSGLTPYTRLPWLVPSLCVLLASFAIFRRAVAGEGKDEGDPR
jgi:apolipoprotein N-acyltransferase